MLTSVSLQMYIALASVHALVLCGLQFIACVRGQWTGRPGGVASLARAAVGGEGGRGLRFQRKSSVSICILQTFGTGSKFVLSPQAWCVLWPLDRHHSGPSDEAGRAVQHGLVCASCSQV